VSGNSFLQWLAIVPLLLVGILSLVSIQSYEVGKKELAIVRRGWRTQFNLKGLLTVRFGKSSQGFRVGFIDYLGTLFIGGCLQNSTHGIVRSYVSNSRKLVVLQFHDQFVVVSPETPGEFVDAISKR